VIPLHIFDRVGGQYRGHLVEDVPVRAGLREVEDLLMPFLGWDPAAGGEDPVRMCTVEDGVDVDHLGLEPQPELHTEAVDVVDDRRQAVRPDVRCDGPVAEARAFVPAATEPAVVEDVAFHADARRPIGQLAQRRGVVVEVHGLPHVHSSRRVRAWSRPAAAVPRHRARSASTKQLALPMNSPPCRATKVLDVRPMALSSTRTCQNRSSRRRASWYCSTSQRTVLQRLQPQVAILPPLAGYDPAYPLIHSNMLWQAVASSPADSYATEDRGVIHTSSPVLFVFVAVGRRRRHGLATR
jgi:hypothetical protein